MISSDTCAKSGFTDHYNGCHASSPCVISLAHQYYRLLYFYEFCHGYKIIFTKFFFYYKMQNFTKIYATKNWSYTVYGSLLFMCYVRVVYYSVCIASMILSSKNDNVVVLEFCLLLFSKT